MSNINLQIGKDGENEIVNLEHRHVNEITLYLIQFLDYTSFKILQFQDIFNLLQVL